MPSLPPGGLTPASAYDIQGQAEQAQPAAILAPVIDPVTGDFGSVFRSASLADAFAVEALRVQRGSGASVRDLGNRFSEITHVEDGITELIESMALEAFGDAERAGVAQLVAVTVEADRVDPSQTSTVVDFRDLLAPPGRQQRRLVLSP
jgi:hypothetical protein